MSEPFIAEIRLFSGNFAPRGWAFCNGQLLPINQNQALFSILGTTYGGDGRVNFALPDLRGRVPMHAGPGFVLGQRAGAEAVTLGVAELPAHHHDVPTRSNQAFIGSPAGRPPSVARAQTFGTGPTRPLSAGLAATGGGQAHENMGPFLTISFIIALVGLFPARN